MYSDLFYKNGYILSYKKIFCLSSHVFHEYCYTVVDYYKISVVKVQGNAK